VVFTGVFEHTLDSKRRLAVPSEIREILREGGFSDVLYVAAGLDGEGLWVWPERTFLSQAQEPSQSLIPGVGRSQFDRSFFARAARLKIDESGRIRIPDRLLSAAGIDKSVAVLGVRDRLEVWEPEAWAAHESLLRETRRQILLRASGDT